MKLKLLFMLLKTEFRIMKVRQLQLLLSMALVLVAVPGFGQSIKIDDIKYKVISDTEATLIDGFRAKGDVVIPEYVTIKKKRYKVTSIGDYAFKKGKDDKYEKYKNKNWCAINSVIIPNSVASIGNYAFAHCRSLSSISLSDSLVSIGDEAFRDCDNLKNIKLPNSVTSIGRFAFSSSGIKSIIIPDGVTCLSGGLFFWSSLESIILPNSITEIGFSVFYNCKHLQSIILPDSVKEIGSEAFRGCERLQSITLPNSVTEIDISIFEGCEELKKIVVPDSMPKITRRYVVENPWGLPQAPIIVGHNGKCPDWVINDVVSNPKSYNSVWLNWAKEQKKNKAAESAASKEQASNMKKKPRQDATNGDTSTGKEETPSDDFLAKWEKTNIYIRGKEFPMSPNVKTVYINEYDTDYQFTDGMLAIRNKETGKWGFIDEDGNLLKGGYKWSYVRYETPRFGAGHCLVALRDEESPYDWNWYILDKEGNTKHFDAGGDIYTVHTFNADGIMSVVTSSDFRGYVSYYDTDGNEVFENISSRTSLGVYLPPLGDFRNDRALFYNSFKKEYGYIDRSGNIIGGKAFLDAQDFSDGLAAVLMETELGRRWGYIDVNGNMVIPPKFSKEPSPFVNGYAVARKQNEKDVFINKNGEVCSEDYEALTRFINGYAFAYTGTEHLAIDSNLNAKKTELNFSVWDLKKEQSIRTVFDGKYIIYNGSLGNHSGLIYIQNAKLYELGNGPFSENRVHVEGSYKDDEHYFLDRSGQVVIKFAKEEF